MTIDQTVVDMTLCPFKYSRILPAKGATTQLRGSYALQSTATNKPV